MAEHPVQGLMGATVEKIREMADANTIIGTPIAVDAATTIIPVSKVTMGFASGGSDVGAKATKEMFGGGSGAGVSITPIAFLVVSNGTVRTVQLAEHASPIDNAINALPELVDKLAALLKRATAQRKRRKPRRNKPGAAVYMEQFGRGPAGRALQCVPGAGLRCYKIRRKSWQNNAYRRCCRTRDTAAAARRSS